MEPWHWAVGGVVAFLLFLWAWRRLRVFGGAVVVERAKEMFRLQRERLEGHFLQAAGQTGKPRGLLWKDCRFDDGALFARERGTGQIAALVGVTISFEAIPGGDMEGLPAVGNLRHGSAVFYFHGGHWATTGKAVFNLNPAETIEHFGKQYEPLP